MNITFSRIIDLTHALTNDTPCWPGDPQVDLRTIATIEHDGYYVQQITLGEHSGTHIGVASHIHAGEAFVDDLPPESLIRRAVKIDVRERCAGNRDYRLTRVDLESWERHNGRIGEATVVLLETGWSERWHDADDYFSFDADGGMHFPGYSFEAAQILAEERGVIGLGIDSPGIDAGMDTELGVNNYWLRGERFHLENLTNLGALPERGFTIVVGVMKIARGSGGPARVLGLV